MRLIAAVLTLLCSLALCAAEPIPAPGTGPTILIVGGGSSHDFNKWFNLADVTTLTEKLGAKVSYTDKIPEIQPRLKDLDVLYLSNNQPMADAELRKAVFDFADAGKGLLLVHPALWYNWGDWKDYNKILVGGGSRGHDAIQEFEVTVEKGEHPVMTGVKNFKVTDELYYFIPDEKGTPIEVLASAKSPKSGKVFPTVFIVKHPKARIVGFTLGHDGRAHDLPEYKQILANAAKWCAGK
jgi:uncharacterized protein